MPPTYSTADKLAAYLQVDPFSATTIPTQTQVEDFLLRAERDIERRTNRAWRTVKNVDYETRDYEYHDIEWPSGWGYSYISKPRVRLKHPNIITPLSAAAGDELEVWRGSSWEEWVGVKTEDRNGDYWINADEGIIYFIRGYPPIRFPDGIRVRYRYGHNVVDPYVEDLATKLVAIMVMEHWKQYAFSSPDLAKPGLDSIIRNLRDETTAKLNDLVFNRDKFPKVV